MRTLYPATPPRFRLLVAASGQGKESRDVRSASAGHAAPRQSRGHSHCPPQIIVSSDPEQLCCIELPSLCVCSNMSIFLFLFSEWLGLYLKVYLYNLIGRCSIFTVLIIDLQGLSITKNLSGNLIPTLKNHQIAQV